MAEFYAELPINIKITGNYHDMGAFASDVAQLPRIVTLNDVAIANDKGDADAWTRSPRPSATSTRKKSPSSAGGQGQGARRKARNESAGWRWRLARASLLAGCGGESHQDLRAWMAEQGKARQGQARPAAAGQALRAVHVQRVRPARPVQAAQDRAGRRATSKLAPDLNRRKEPLEAFPLESLTMVGTLQKDKAVYALVRTPEKDIYQVRAGQLHGPELRRHHRDHRQRDQAEGTRAGQRRRLDRAVEHAAAASQADAKK